MSLAQWPVELLHRMPSRVVDDIHTALEHGQGENSIQDVFSGIADGSKQVWTHVNDDKFNATVVTQVVQHPQKKVLEILYLGGDVALVFLDEIKEIEEFARNNGCSDMHVIGRRGWLKVLETLDYEPRYTIIGKSL